ncbi:MAG: hypothetical protein AB7V42_06190 [Thermoleophilia bacterium]
MNAAARLGGFAAILAVVAGVAVAVGAGLDPLREAGDGAGRGHDHGHEGGDAPAHGGHGAAPAAEGLSLRPERSELPRGRSAELAFRVVDRDGVPVTRFDARHERGMHLIVVRSDLTGFQHLHPEMGGDGLWTTPIVLPEAGVHRAYADFSTGGSPAVLTADLSVAGAVDPVPLPPPSAAAETEGYRVELSAPRMRAGDEATLAYAITRDGAPVADIRPYLGAGGHLVALREGDLAFQHVHPRTETAAGGRISFAASFPAAGRYRLFVQFLHDGAVRTAEHTVEVDPA